VTGGLAFLLIAVIVSAVGVLVLWLRNRDSASVDSGVDEFRREMRALAPNERDEERRRR
jgi:hypothetical protein